MDWNRGNIALILKRYGNTFDKKKKKTKKKQNHSTLKGKLGGSQQKKQKILKGKESVKNCPNRC